MQVRSMQCRSSLPSKGRDGAFDTTALRCGLDRVQQQVDQYLAHIGGGEGNFACQFIVPFQVQIFFLRLELKR